MIQGYTIFSFNCLETSVELAFQRFASKSLRGDSESANSDALFTCRELCTQNFIIFVWRLQNIDGFDER
jgi:hypothetical protein